MDHEEVGRYWNGNALHRRNLRNEHGRIYAIEVGDYFRNRDGEIEQWLFHAVPADVKAGLSPFKIPLFTHTVSQWLNLLIATGFVVEQVEEPRPSDAAVRACPAIQDTQVTAFFLHLRTRKP